MNEERSFERFVADQVTGSQGGVPMPDDFYDDMHSFASSTRQRPEWLALIKEPPMRTNSRLAAGSPTARVAAIVVATLLLAITLAAAGIAGQRLLAADAQIVVAQDGSGNYTTINEAVAAAVDGDEILVKSGTYEESIVVDKDIALLGEARDAVVIDFGAGCAFDDDFWQWSCPDGTPLATREWASGFTLESPFGIHIEDAEAEISTLSVVDGHDGDAWSISANGGAPLIHDVRLTSNVHTPGGLAFLWNGSAATVRDSEMGMLHANDLSPVNLTESVVFDVAINDMNNGSTGGEAVIRKNELGSISLAGPVLVEDNQFPESMAADAEPIGVLVVNGGDWVIRNNVIHGRQTGIEALTDGTLEGNVIERNGIGFYHVGDAPEMSGNRICDNSIVNVRSLGNMGSGSPSDTGDVAGPDTATNEVCPDPES